MEGLKIPLARPYASQEHLEAIKRVFESGMFIQGKEIQAFEKEFANLVGRKYAVATSSGTAALHLALLAAGVKEADEVITVSHTFIATLESIWYVRAKPKLADIDADYYTMDTSTVEALISDKTRAIIPVHIFGHPVDMDPLRELAAEHDLRLIEDAAQAHGSRYRGKSVGTLGDLACFSFYPSKNMTVCGDGGIVMTDIDEMAKSMRMLRDHGRVEKYSSEVVGYNYRMSEIAGAIGRISLRYLQGWNDKRRAIASNYSKLLSGDTQLVLPKEADWAHHVYHVYAVRSKRRDELRTWLGRNGIQTGIHYPIPCHLQAVFSKMESDKVHLRKTEEASRELLSLPMYPEMTEEEIEYVAAKVKEFSQNQL